MVRPMAFHRPGSHSSSQTCNRTKMMREQLETRHEVAAHAAAPATCPIWPAPASYVASFASVNCKGTCPPIDRGVTRVARHRSATHSNTELSVTRKLHRKKKRTVNSLKPARQPVVASCLANTFTLVRWNAHVAITSYEEVHTATLLCAR